jgi:hypothetical protein
MSIRKLNINKQAAMHIMRDLLEAVVAEGIS